MCCDLKCIRYFIDDFASIISFNLYNNCDAGSISKLLPTGN